MKKLLHFVSCLSLLTCVLHSSAAAQTTSTVFQDAPGAAPEHLNRSVTMTYTSNPSASYAWTDNSSHLSLRNFAERVLVDFPQIIGSSGQSIPAGATVTSATLELWCTDMASSGVVRQITATPVVDFDHLGTWHEPVSPGVQVWQSGANWLRRDGRATVDTPWDLSGDVPPTLANSPTLLGSFPGLRSTHNVHYQGGALGSPANSWHSFDVTTAVQLWSHGISNQGWMLESDIGAMTRYASDDHPTSTLRPRLSVTWVTASAGNPVNHIPEILPPSPGAQVSLSEGSTVPFVLAGTDADGTVPTFRLMEKPRFGTLTGIAPFFTYRPDRDFSGTDSFTYTVYDELCVANPQRIEITVAPQSGALSRTFQLGSSGGIAADTRMAHIYQSPWPGNQRTFNQEVIYLDRLGRFGFLAFPQLIGPAGEQIPAGSQILSAELTLTTSGVVGALSETKQVSLTQLIDPLGRGSIWHEPTSSSGPSGCHGCGVSWMHPDSRIPAGSNTPAHSWNTPGGDVHPYRGSSFYITRDEYGELVKTTDVTHTVQAWANGEPNHGWRINVDTANPLSVWSDDAPLVSKRPKLRITYRPPWSAPLSIPLPPISHAGPDQSVFAHQSVQLDARQSMHPLGIAFSNLWIQTGGPIVNLAGAFTSQPSFTAPAVTAVTDLVFTYAAYEGQRFAIDEVRVVVYPQPGNGTISSPNVDAGQNTSLPENRPHTMQATVTGGTGNFDVVWTQLSGTRVDLANPYTLSPSFTTPVVGQGVTETLVFDLKVTDTGVPQGMTSIQHDTLVLQITDTQNQAPIVVVVPVPTVENGDWITLDARQSSDPDNHPLTFTWTRANGPAVNLGQYVTQGTLEAAWVPLQVPQVSTTTTLHLRVAAHDGELTTTQDVYITILPTPSEFGGVLTLAPYRNQLSEREAKHLLRRMGEGWHPSLVSGVRAIGKNAAINYALTITPEPQVETEAVDYALRLVTTYNTPPPYINPGTDPYPQANQIQVAGYWNIYAMRTRNPLRERLVRFFHDRFAARASAAEMGQQHWPFYYSKMLREGGGSGTGALGNYRGLLKDLVRDPLMLWFLNGFLNTAASPNENLAREFMELHTLGVRSPTGQRLYSEQDISEVAKAFTGWNYDCGASNQQLCTPFFDPANHDSGPKQLFANGSGGYEFTGNYDDHGIVDVILAKNGGLDAGRWLGKGLLETFVMANPPQGLIDEVANRCTALNWNLTEIMREILSSQAMFSSQAYKAVAKSHIDYAVGLLRTLNVPLQTWDIAGATNSNGDSLAYYIRLMNQELGQPAAVNGWPKDLYWMSGYSVVRRGELARHAIRLAKQPTDPGFTAGLPYPNYLGYPALGVPGSPPPPTDANLLMPPAGARRTNETLRTLMRFLDVDLRETPAPGNGVSEFALAEYFFGTWGYNNTPRPFNGDDPSQMNKLWETLLLLAQTPDFHRM